jgi:hypothetical protein
MGVVYKARGPFTGRLIAFKTRNSSLVDRPDIGSNASIRKRRPQGPPSAADPSF